jgi:hypothetical protein
MTLIDSSFDFRSDSYGKDPDIWSKTLKNYHKILWSKELPNGESFNLQDEDRSSYLSFVSANNQISLSSDSISHSYKNVIRMKNIIQQIDPAEIESFRNLGSTIGGFVIFPSKRIEGKMNINGARGFNSKIGDRFDLTLECIRRHYSKEASPLDEVLNRYENFFELFITFKNYVNFFFLNDLVNSNYTKIELFIQGQQPFSRLPFPQSVEEYGEYKSRSMEFVARRNARISANYLLP